MPTNRISVRSYSEQLRSHFHDYHQLVMPLHGTIKINMGQFQDEVGIGDCLIIKSGQVHYFKADEQARFIVIDTQVLPDNILKANTEKVAIDNALLTYIQFVEIQLRNNVNFALEAVIFDLFYQLLAQQSFLQKCDKRIEKVLRIIKQDLSQNHPIDDLAKKAYLSNTQFKKLFKDSTGKTCKAYVTELRMEKAKALITHTDTPINIVAEYCGYQSPSAFSRKFRSHFNSSPNTFVK